MPTVSQRQVLIVIRDKINMIDERYEDYDTDLTELLYEALEMEKTRPHKIQQRFSSAISYIAERLIQRGGNTE